MYKRLFAAMTALCLMLTLMPVSALAAEEEINTIEKLQAAIGAAESGAVIKLSDDLIITETVKISAEVPVTIDTTDITDAFTVTSGELTLAENITIESETSVLYANGGNIVIDGAMINVTGAPYSAAYVDDGSIEIKSGSINQSGTNNITLSVDATGTATISGGAVTSENSSAVLAKNGGEVTIDGENALVKTLCEDPTFCAAFARNSGKITLENGEITAAAGKGLVAVADGIVIVNGGTINGGVVAHENANAKATITDGTIYGTVYAANDATLAISGGTFDEKPADDYIAEELKAIEINGEWTIMDDDTTVVVNGTEGYATLSDAINAANNEDVITVLQDIEVAEALTINKAITIEADEAVTITSTATDLFTVTSGELTLAENITIESETSVLYANGGNIVIDGAMINVTGAPYSAAYVDDGSIEIKSGSINQSGTNNITLSVDATGTATISGGAVTSENSSAVLAKNGGEVTIDGENALVKTLCEDPTFCAAFARNGGKITLENGEITAAAGKGLVAVADGIVIINGGTINGGVVAHENANAKATITDGTIYGTVYAANDATLAISGGTFDEKPADAYIVEGFEAVEAESAWIVREETSTETPSASAPVTESYDVAIADSANGSVTANTMRAGETSRVTLTVKADAGYVLESLTVTDKNGKEIKLTEKDGKYQFRMPASDVTVKAVFAAAEAEAPAKTFTDVAENAYYHDAVQWAVENGITNGMTETTFAPKATCTRAQMVTFLWRAAGCPVPQNAEHTFTDLDKDAYYYNAVLWAIEKGITNGVSLDAFDPNGIVTRGQAMTFLWRMDGKTAADADHTFTDVEDGAYYEDAVAWGADEAITNGTSATTFSPDDACIRGQIVTFLYNYLVK